MPDAWEILHGLNSLADDRDENPDGDALSNWEEYVLDSDPNHNAPAPDFTIEISNEQDQVLFSFESSSSRYYILEYRNNLEEGEWQSVGEPFWGKGAVMDLAVNITSSRGFYRLRTLLP